MGGLRKAEKRLYFPVRMPRFRTDSGVPGALD